MAVSKKCIRCNSVKELNEFYLHKRMKDGHLNVCKECKKNYARIYCRTERGKEVDRKRNQKPNRKKLQYIYCKRKRLKHRKKYLCVSKFWNEFRKGTIKKLPCEVCGTEERVEAHHSDYDKPYNVIWLCSLHHKEWHRNNEVKNGF